MVRKLASFALFAGGLVAGQSTTVSCCECEDSRWSGDVIRLSDREMRDHVDHIEPFRTSGLGKGLRLAGTVVVEIRFESSGKVECARAKSGHPIAITAAMEVVSKWTFKPPVRNGAAKAVCGIVKIRYRLRNQGSSTELK